MTDYVHSDLSHFGVKGMRWGIRKSQQEGGSGGTGPTEVQVTSVPGKSIRTSGGKGLPASSEAIDVAKLNQKLRSSGMQSLTTAELQTVVTRQNLESQYAKLNPKQKNAKIELLKYTAPKLALSSLELAKKYHGSPSNPYAKIGLAYTGALLKAISPKQPPQDDLRVILGSTIADMITGMVRVIPAK